MATNVTSEPLSDSDIAARKTVIRPDRSILLSRALKISLWSGGILFLVWAFRDPRFRGSEGFVSGKFCLPVATGVALIVLGWTANGPWRRFALWFALAMIGQAVALQMIDAGPLIHYQHYKSLPQLFAENALLPIYVIAQTVVVLAALKSRWSDIRAWVARSLNRWQLIGLALVFLVFGAAMSRNIRFYIAELLFAAFVQLLSLATIVLMTLAIPEGAATTIKGKIGRLFTAARGSEDKAGWRFAVLVALWVTVLAAVLNIASYGRHPHLVDEVVYLAHARYLAAGMITAPAPPVPEAFNISLMEIDKGKWYAAPPPGWPLALAVGILLGVPWLVNPVLAGLNVLLAYLLIDKLYDRRIASWVVLLLGISPWHLFMGMNFMTHTFTLTCALIAAIGVTWARSTGKSRWAWLAGSALGIASLIRPLDGLILAIVLGLWATALGGRRLTFSSFAGLVLAAVLTGSIVLPYNKLITGNSTVFPLMAYTDRHYGPKTNALGFGPERGLGWPLQPFPGHSPLGATVNATLNSFSLNIELFGWSMGSLLLIALLLFSRTLGRSDYLMVGLGAAVFGLHFFYWYSGGPDFGARYWYLMLIPLVVLTARGIQLVKTKADPRSGGSAIWGARITLSILSLCAITLVTYVPWRAIDKYHNYLRMRPDVRYLAREYGFGRSIVLIRGDEYPDFASAAVYNPLNLHSNVPIYAWDKNPAVRSQVLQEYADRPVWVINGPSLTGSGFTVVKGPVSALDLEGGSQSELLNQSSSVR